MKWFVFLLLFVGCASTETMILDKAIKVAPTVIHDTIAVVRHDTTIVEAVKVVKGDTVVQIQYYPKTEKIYYKVKPDTVTVTYRDTTKIRETIVQQTPFLSKLGLVLIGIAVCIAGGLIWRFKAIL